MIWGAGGGGLGVGGAWGHVAMPSIQSYKYCAFMCNPPYVSDVLWNYREAWLTWHNYSRSHEAKRLQVYRLKNVSSVVPKIRKSISEFRPSIIVLLKSIVFGQGFQERWMDFHWSSFQNRFLPKSIFTEVADFRFSIFSGCVTSFNSY